MVQNTTLGWNLTISSLIDMNQANALLSGARFNCYSSSPLETEAKLVMWATIHARQRGCSKVIFDSDSLCLINAHCSRSPLLLIASIFTHILANSLDFNMCNWSFVKREGNKVVDCIANWALGCNDEVVLEDRVPDCACVWVSEDVSSNNFE